MSPAEPRIIVDRQFELGENPLWDDRRKLLFWTDIDTGELWKYDPKTETAERFYEGPKVGGFTLEVDGKLALFRVQDIVLINPDHPEEVEPLAHFHNENVARFNDVMALPDGSVYAGTIAARSGSGGLYHVGLDLSIRELFLGTDVSNGMALPDEHSLIWTCSSSRRIVRFSRDQKTNAVNKPVDLYTSPEEEGTPDGLCLDAEGHIWSARWDGSAVIVHGPDGSPIRKVHVPTTKVTSVCFGGDSLTTLFITTSRGPVYAMDTDTHGLLENRSRLGLSRQPDRP
ncbi:MAG: SMP-30/gluconolactonase/LRE family protein [Phycisphaera sp.]|nr:MAG: SMP-30/gluconolactonase/LRE family protein [Phycisphaera sp.]